MKKTDHRKELAELYTAPTEEPKVVQVPPLNYLMIDGQGHPEEREFQDAVRTLYAVAYPLKFMVKRAANIDYQIMPLEVKWTVNREKKGDFRWTAMILLPEAVTPDLLVKAVEKVEARRSPPLISWSKAASRAFGALMERLGLGAPLLSRLRLANHPGGTYAQLMHTGSYKGMNDVWPRFDGFVQRNGYRYLERNSHDVYLNNTRKPRPEKVRVIVRLPIQKAS